MEEVRNECPEQKLPKKSSFQTAKECWYDQLNVTVRQLDVIIGVCTAALVLIFVYIALVAFGVL